MSPSRFAKSLIRRLRVMSREQPTQYDIEALEDNVTRVGLVIRFRWMIVTALAAFSVSAAAIYSLEASIPRSDLLANMWIPAAALLFVLAYNTYYHVTYRYLGNIAILNHAQLLFDTLVISVLVHYSGGVYSWFYTMYALIVLEAAFIFPRARDTWLVAGVAVTAYATVIFGEYLDILAHVPMPLVSQGLEHSVSYTAVRLLWALTLLAGTALVSLLLMRDVHERESQLSASSMRDETTGLYNRTYFRQKLDIELQRARCYDQSLSVLLIDIDDFTAFNRRFGLEAGNRVIRAVASLLTAETCVCPDCGVAKLSTICRYGGEEFGIIIPQPPRMTHEQADADAAVLADRLVGKIGALRVDDMGITVSVGVACYPRDGRTAAEIMTSADQAVVLAAAAGGNRFATSDEAIAAATG